MGGASAVLKLVRSLEGGAKEAAELGLAQAPGAWAGRQSGSCQQRLAVVVAQEPLIRLQRGASCDLTGRWEAPRSGWLAFALADLLVGAQAGADDVSRRPGFRAKSR